MTEKVLAILHDKNVNAGGWYNDPRGCIQTICVMPDKIADS